MKYTPDLLYKYTGSEGEPCNGGTGQWGLPKNGKPGKWFAVKGELEPYELHLCRGTDLLDEWSGPELYVAEYQGRIIERADKVVARKARLVERVETWNARTQRLFACDCTERALKLADCKDKRSWKAIEVARRFAAGEADSDELEATRAAATNAAWDAVVWDAPMDAVRAAARDVTRDAPWGVARGVEPDWQRTRLFQYLNGEVA